jgi:hypothetical protein
MNTFYLTPITVGLIIFLILTLRPLFFPSYARYCNFNVFTAPRDEKLVFIIITLIEAVLVYFLLQLDIHSAIKNIIFVCFILFSQVLPQATINAYRSYYKKN